MRVYGGYMAWIGIECGIEAWELRKWADYVRRAGGAGTAEFLERCGKLAGGETCGVNMADRMLEIERRAAEAMERTRAGAASRAAAIIGRLMGDGVSMADVMSAAGMDGWRAGSAAGGKNGGVARRNRKKFGPGSAVVAGGKPVAVAEKGTPPVTAAQTVERDRRYALTWEAWAGTELRKSGFKMSAAARGIGLADVAEAWRYVSAFEKHWRREGLRGRAFPGPAEGWAERLEEARLRAMNAGMRGARVVLNGTRDCGLGAVSDTGSEKGDL